MARNWAISPRKARALRFADLLLSPVALAARLRGTAPIPDAPKILILEFWRLGDAVMVEPLLRAVRESFPRAEICLLCTAASRQLLKPNGIVDRFFEIEVPWTSFDRKYDWRRYVASSFVATIRDLRRERFDVTLDSRMDLRSNILAWLIGARRRVGFDVPGGRGLLTDRIIDPGEGTHKVEDWLAMLGPLGVAPSPTLAPAIQVPASVQARVDCNLRELGIRPGTQLVGMHPSARQTVRRWPLEKFAELAREVAGLPDTRVLVLVDPDGYGEELSVTGAVCVRADLEELPAYLHRCSVFVGNDTGPAHIAAAVGATTVTIFGPGAIDWFRPFGVGQQVVYLAPMPCRPCFDQCTRTTNICLQELSTAAVRDVVLQEIARRHAGGRRVDGRAPTSEIVA